VKRLRRAAFGEPPKKSKAQSMTEALARIEALERKVAALMADRRVNGASKPPLAATQRPT